MPRMTDAEIQHVFDDYNRIRAKENYWIWAGLALVEHLHKTHGMRYADIYAIAESGEYAKRSKADLDALRMDDNVIDLWPGMHGSVPVDGNHAEAGSVVT